MLLLQGSINFEHAIDAPASERPHGVTLQRDQWEMVTTGVCRRPVSTDTWHGELAPIMYGH